MVVRVDRWDRLPAKELTRASRLTPLLRDEGRLSIRVDLDDFDQEACGPWDLEGDPLLQGRDRLAALRFVEEDLRAVGGYGFREPWRLRTAFSHGQGAFAVAGVKTFVRETWAAPPAGAQSVTTSPIDDLWFWKSPVAMPRGFFVSKVLVGDDDAAFAALDTPALLSTQVVVDQGTPSDAPACEAPVETSELRAEVVEQKLTACAAGVVVLADAWYPGWNVDIDGVAAQPLRAWGFVRAVRVTQGPHTITWRYEPTSFRLGAALTLVGLLLLAITRIRSRAR
jgi:hypothetical protein